ncbi:hypothetical protein HFO81_00835 [Rhizobium leguminosarum]|uniref:hypothetical protein n=1 Tax=Rhizobium leguminosarum TaxID=384 RepID=UPI001C96C989|nr:hypothetical protein [Rhizobium leguminosarum]MBY5504084.1 hypothetical protein [Rhizobium leguminosarum]
MHDAEYVEGVLRDRIRWVLDGVNPSYFGPENALLKYGKRMDVVVDRPLRIPEGLRRECYGNCVKALLSKQADDDLFYAEGYAIGRGGPWILVQHAWLVDQHGRVIDPTWEDAADNAYFGVVFRRRFVCDMLEKAQMEPGILSAPVLMCRHFGSPTLFEAAMEPRFHRDSELPKVRVQMA